MALAEDPAAGVRGKLLDVSGIDIPLRVSIESAIGWDPRHPRSERAPDPLLLSHLSAGFGKLRDLEVIDDTHEMRIS